MGLEVEVVGETNKFDIIVIGGGVAGMTASSIVTQLGLKSCFLEKNVPGGKLINIDKIHNFPPQPNISGKDLGLSIFKQAVEEIKTIYIYGDVQSIRPKNNLFYLFTADGQTWEAKAIIIAVGTQIKKLNVQGEDKYFNHGLSYCVMCDKTLAKNKKVALIGNKEYLNDLSKYASSIDCYEPNEIKSIDGNNKILTGLTKIDGTKKQYDFIFISNNFEPCVDFLPSDIETDNLKQIIVDQTMASPYMEGVFACGDCINNKAKLIQPAIEQATIAAQSAVNYVKSKNW